MEEILVFGHKNPDTDSICSSIAMSNLRKQQGFNAIPCRLGEINKETKFVFSVVKCLSFVFSCLWAEGKPVR